MVEILCVDSFDSYSFRCFVLRLVSSCYRSIIRGDIRRGVSSCSTIMSADGSMQGMVEKLRKMRWRQILEVKSYLEGVGFEDILVGLPEEAPPEHKVFLKWLNDALTELENKAISQIEDWPFLDPFNGDLEILSSDQLNQFLTCNKDGIEYKGGYGASPCRKDDTVLCFLSPAVRRTVKEELQITDIVQSPDKGGFVELLHAESSARHDGMANCAVSGMNAVAGEKLFRKMDIKGARRGVHLTKEQVTAALRERGGFRIEKMFSGDPSKTKMTKLLQLETGIYLLLTSVRTEGGSMAGHCLAFNAWTKMVMDNSKSPNRRYISFAKVDINEAKGFFNAINICEIRTIYKMLVHKTKLPSCHSGRVLQDGRSRGGDGAKVNDMTASASQDAVHDKKTGTNEKNDGLEGQGSGDGSIRRNAKRSASDAAASGGRPAKKRWKAPASPRKVGKTKKQTSKAMAAQKNKKTQPKKKKKARCA